MQTKKIIRSVVYAVLFGTLAGCHPAAGVTSPANDSSLFLLTLPAAWTETPSPTATFIFPPTDPPSPTLTSTESSTATPRVEQTLAQTAVTTPTRHPTHRPTPTRGLPPTATLSPKEECPPPTHAQVEINSVVFISDYSSQILEYFRAYGDRAELEEQLERIGHYEERTVNEETGEKEKVFVPNVALFTEVDLTGDQKKETLITLKQQSYGGYHMEIGIFIVGCRDRQFRMLHSEYLNELTPSESIKSGIADILDLNADGIQEIILSRYHEWGTAHADVSNEYMVLEWDGTRIRSLYEEPEANYPRVWIEAMNSRIELRDIDGNGTTELLFPNAFFAPYCGLGPYRLEKAVYMWDGEFYRYVWTDRDTPKYRFQAAFDGDYFASIGLYDKSEKMYQQALTDSKLKEYLQENPIGGCSTPPVYNPDEPLQIMAYTRFRALELHAYLHKVNDAEKDLNYLVSNYQTMTPGYLFASWADIFWKAYQADNNIDDACSAVVNAARPYEKDGFGLMYYGDLNPGPTLDTICPFHSGSG